MMAANTFLFRAESNTLSILDILFFEHAPGSRYKVPFPLTDNSGWKKLSFFTTWLFKAFFGWIIVFLLAYISVQFYFVISRSNILKDHKKFCP